MSQHDEALEDTPGERIKNFIVAELMKIWLSPLVLRYTHTHTPFIKSNKTVRQKETKRNFIWGRLATESIKIRHILNAERKLIIHPFILS